MNACPDNQYRLGSATDRSECARECLSSEVEVCVHFIFANWNATVPCRLAEKCVEYTVSRQGWTGYLHISQTTTTTTTTTEDLLLSFVATSGSNGTMNSCDSGYTQNPFATDVTECARSCLTSGLEECVHFRWNNNGNNADALNARCRLSRTCVGYTVSRASWTGYLHTSQTTTTTTTTTTTSTTTTADPLLSFVATEGVGARNERTSNSCGGNDYEASSTAQDVTECASECLSSGQCVHFIFAHSEDAQSPCRLSRTCKDYTVARTDWTGYMRVSQATS